VPTTFFARGYRYWTHLHKQVHRLQPWPDDNDLMVYLQVADAYDLNIHLSRLPTYLDFQVLNLDTKYCSRKSERMNKYTWCLQWAYELILFLSPHKWWFIMKYWMVCWGLFVTSHWINDSKWLVVSSKTSSTVPSFCPKWATLWARMREVSELTTL